MGTSLSRLWWMGGLVWVAASCAGRVSSESRAPSGGSGGTPAPAAEGGAAGADPGGGGAGQEDDSHCTGKLKEVASAFGFACPDEFCAASLLASDCAALPGNVTKTISEQCHDYADDLSVTFQLSPTQRKVCYYGSATYDSDATLIGAEVWDDAADLCGGKASRILGGHVSKACDTPPGPPVTLCDLYGPEQPKPGGPPRACFNKLSRSCQPCCAATSPDCSDEPDGYPGYECTPVGSPDPDDTSAWCSCRCDRAEWACLC